MNTIREIIACKKTEGDLGLEIEVEGHNLPNLLGSVWKCEHDGSLRGESCEYVLKHPTDVDGIKDALDYLDKQYAAAGARPTESFRAGVHVHVNCQELTFIELFNFITLYLIFENLFVRWCGHAREGNLFCLRSSDAEYVLDELSRSLKIASNHRDLSYFLQMVFSEDQIRYLSMNLGALGKYGSLEFRAMRSTPNLSLIYGWANVLYSLRETAKTYSNPQAIMHEFSFKGTQVFIDDVLGVDVATMFKNSSENYRKDLIDGVRNAQEIAFSGDWDVIKTIECNRLARTGRIPDLVVDDAQLLAAAPKRQKRINPQREQARIWQERINAVQANKFFVDDANNLVRQRKNRNGE